MLTVAQAFAVAALVVEVVTDPGGDGWQTAAWWVVAVVGLRALASYAVDVRLLPPARGCRCASGTG